MFITFDIVTALRNRRMEKSIVFVMDSILYFLLLCPGKFMSERKTTQTGIHPHIKNMISKMDSRDLTNALLMSNLLAVI